MAFGIFDRLNNKHIIRKTIQKKDLPKDEKYHLYYVGRTLIRNYRLWAHPSWFFVLDLNEAANPGAPDAMYIYRLKFRGHPTSKVQNCRMPFGLTEFLWCLFLPDKEQTLYVTPQ